MIASQIKAVLFDLDDTLIDHRTAYSTAVVRVYRQYQELSTLYQSASSFQLAWGIAHKTFYPRFLKGELTHDEQRILRVRAVWSKNGLRLPDHECLEISDIFLKHYSNEWRVFSDVIPCLKALAAKKLGIVTNGWGEQQRAKVSACGLSEYFNDIVVSSEVGCAKPDPEIYQLAAERLGLAPASVAFVGDLFEYDVEGPKNAGMLPIWLNRTESVQSGTLSIPGVRVIHSLENLLGPARAR